MENEENQNQNQIEAQNKKNKLEEDFQKKLEKNQFKIMTTFKKVRSQYSDGIIPIIKHHKREIGDSLKHLMGEDNYERERIKQKRLLQLKDLKASKSSSDISHMSPGARALTKKIRFQINKVKKSHEDLTALNALYLDNSNSFKEINNNDRYKNNFNLIKSLDSSNYEEAIRKKNLRNNFELMGDKFHKGLSKAFINKFNPDKYLDSLKTLIKASPTVRDDVTKPKKEIEDDIKNITDKSKYRKRYKRLIEKKIKNNSLQMLDPQLYKPEEIGKKSNTVKKIEMSPGFEKSKNSIFLPNIGGRKNFMNNRDNRIKMGIVAKLQKNENKKIMNTVEQQFDHMNKLYNITKEIDNYIGNENIEQKIETNMHDYKMHKYLNSLKKNDDKEISIFKPKDYYFLQRHKIDDLFGDLLINKLKTRVLDKERKLTDKLKLNKYDYFSKIVNEMKISLNEFDNNMNTNKIDIKENPKNDLEIPENN